MSTLQYGPSPNLPVLGAARAELNDLFDAAVTNQLNDDNLLRTLFRRMPQTGNPYGFRVRTARNPTALTQTEPTDSDALPDSRFGNQTRLRVAEEAAILFVGVSITDYMLRSSSGAGGIDVMLEEISDATMDFRELEEENFFAIRSGTIAGESATSMVGIPHVLQDATPTPTDTDTLYGVDRVANPILFATASYNGGTPRPITQLLIDTNARQTRDLGGKLNLYLTNEETHDNVNNIFQGQQRFMNEVNVPGGFVLTTYRGIPIATSVNCSSRDGATLVNTPGGPGDWFGMDLRWWEMRVLKEAQLTDIAKDGPTAKRYIEAFQQLICKRPNSSYAIYDLS